MATSSLELPLPELVAEDFHRGWTRFEFVAAAQKWDADKQLTVIPTLLRGKLIDYYVELDDGTKTDLALLKAALQERAGKKEDPLMASRRFNQRNQGQSEKVTDFADALKKLFKSAYPEEAITSAVLLQRFLTGLRPEIVRQLLLRTKPTDFPTAVKTAVDVEHALEFDGSDDRINAIGHTTQKPTQAPDVLQQSIETLTKRLESLEATMQKTHKPRTTPRPFQESKGYTSRQSQRRYRRDQQPGPCYNCGAFGHFFRNCPLNYYGPAPPVDASWPRHQ